MVGWNGWFPWHLSRKQLYIGKNNLRDSEWAHRISISTYRFNRRVYHREIFDHYGKDMLWKTEFLNRFFCIILFLFNILYLSGRALVQQPLPLHQIKLVSQRDTSVIRMIAENTIFVWQTEVNGSFTILNAELELFSIHLPTTAISPITFPAAKTILAKTIEAFQIYFLSLTKHNKCRSCLWKIQFLSSSIS
jgi:hypothetical protein